MTNAENYFQGPHSHIQNRYITMANAVMPILSDMLGVCPRSHRKTRHNQGHNTLNMANFTL